MKTKYFFILIALLTLLSACSGFLERLPSSSVSGQDLFSNKKTARAALIGLYNDIQNGNFTGRNTMFRADLKGPDFMLISGGGQYMVVEYAYRESSATTGNSYDIWQQGFRTVKDCNIFLDVVQELGLDDPEVADMVAQAKAIKALAYLELAKTFCYPPSIAAIDSRFALGLPLMKDKNDNVTVIEEGASRASLMETYEYIIAILQEALEGINASRPRGANMAKCGIQGLLARSYLIMENWDKAAFYALEAAAAGRLLDYDSFLASANESLTSESLFELVYNETDYLGDRMLGYIMNQTVDANNRNTSTSVGYGEVGAADCFLDLLKENPKDIRIGLLHEDKLSTASATQWPLIHGVGGYSERYYYKYIGGQGGNVFVHNVPVVKVSEMLLIAAEAYAENGDDAKALGYLNQVYVARTTTKLEGLAGKELKTAIFNERRRELALQGFGIFDYLRKGIGFTRDASHNKPASVDPATAAGRSSANFYQTVAPIPQNEMDANPLIRDQQNPGYSAYQNGNK